MPKIIDYLWVDGLKGKRKRLSVYAKELYRIIRGVAANGKPCYLSIQSLAKLVGCSVGSISKAKKELLQPLDMLDGQSLINEGKRVKRNNDTSKKNFKTEYCVYEINDIWAWNNAFFESGMHKDGWLDEEIEFEEELQEDDDFEIQEPHSLYESGTPPHSPYESAPQGPHSPGESNNNKTKEKQLLKEQQSAADADRCFLKKEKELSPSAIKARISKEQKESFIWLKKAGFQDNEALKLSKSYSIDELKKAGDYLAKQRSTLKKKNSDVKNPHGYFIQSLKGKYWEERKNS